MLPSPSGLACLVAWRAWWRMGAGASGTHVSEFVVSLEIDSGTYSSHSIGWASWGRRCGVALCFDPIGICAWCLAGNLAQFRLRTNFVCDRCAGAVCWIVFGIREVAAACLLRGSAWIRGAERPWTRLRRVARDLEFDGKWAICRCIAVNLWFHGLLRCWVSSIQSAATVFVRCVECDIAPVLNLVVIRGFWFCRRIIYCDVQIVFRAWRCCNILNAIVIECDWKRFVADLKQVLIVICLAVAMANNFVRRLLRV